MSFPLVFGVFATSSSSTPGTGDSSQDYSYKALNCLPLQAGSSVSVSIYSQLIPQDVIEPIKITLSKLFSYYKELQREKNEEKIKWMKREKERKKKRKSACKFISASA